MPPQRRDREAPSSAKALRRLGELLVAAKAVFERDGFFATRVADIAALANASHGTFYTYFDSKEDVFAVLVEELVEATFGASQVHHDAGTTYEQLEASIRDFLRTYAEQAGMHRVLEQAVAASDDFLAIRSAIRARFVERIRRSIVSLQEQGIAGQDIDPLPTAHVLGGMVQDSAFTLYILRHPIDPEAIAQALTRTWAVTVGIPIERTAKRPVRSRGGRSARGHQAAVDRDHGAGEVAAGA